MAKQEKQNKQNDECTFCKKTGPKREGCFKLVGYPDWWPGKKDEKAKPKAAYVETGTSPVPWLNEGKYQEFIKFFSRSSNNVEAKLEANMAGNKDDVWVVDSGCTEYITYKSNLLENNKGTSNKAPVVIPNGHAIPVDGKGDFILPGGAKINGVLHIPNFKHNLHSVSRICKDLQCAVTFFPNFCVMQGLHTRSLIGSGSLDCNTDEPTKGHDDFKSTNFFLDSGEQSCFDGPPKIPLAPQQKIQGLKKKMLPNMKMIFFTNNSPVLGPEIEEDHAISHKELEPRSKRIRTQPAHVSEYVVNLSPLVTNSQPGSNKANSIVHLISHFVSYDKFSHSHKASLTIISSNHEPSCSEQATQDEKWRNAMQQEIKDLEKNGTWTLEELPEGKRPIDFKWVYKTKFKSNEEAERYKARLVAKGCTQREGVDYYKTFAPVAKLVTVQTLLVAGVYVAILIYMDDVIIVGDNSEKIQQIKQQLEDEFSIKNLGPLKYFLGIEVAKTSDRLVGRLLYLQATRPDVTYAVNILSQFVSDPRQNHLEAAKRVLRYLKGTSGQGILLSREGPTTLTAYCDSDWLGYPFTRRSRTGCLLLFSGGPISWKTKKQLVVSRSSAEAEYRAMVSTVSEILWVRWLLKDMQVQLITPTSLFCDNQAARHIANNPVYHERTKHVEMDCFFVRKRVETREIETKPIESKLQLADLLTKGLDTQQLRSKENWNTCFVPSNVVLTVGVDMGLYFPILAEFCCNPLPLCLPLAYALTAKGVRLVCTNTTGKNKNSGVLKTQGSGSLKDNIITLFGMNTFNSLEPVNLFISDTCQVDGFLSMSGYGDGRNIGDQQYYFVNGRPVDMPKFSLKQVSADVSDSKKEASSEKQPQETLKSSPDVNLVDVEDYSISKKDFTLKAHSLKKDDTVFGSYSRKNTTISNKSSYNRHVSSYNSTMQKNVVEGTDSPHSGGRVQSLLIYFVTVNRRKHESIGNTLSEVPIHRNGPTLLQSVTKNLNAQFELAKSLVNHDVAIGRLMMSLDYLLQIIQKGNVSRENNFGGFKVEETVATVIGGKAQKYTRCGTWSQFVRAGNSWEAWVDFVGSLVYNGEGQRTKYSIYQPRMNYSHGFGYEMTIKGLVLPLVIEEVDVMRTVGDDELLSKVVVAPESTVNYDSFKRSMVCVLSKFGSVSR
nr:integrase, catalytic core [Tanacetum cinerariifolium]